MRIIPRNVAGRTGVLETQLSAVVGQRPDVLCLQEVTSGSYGLWRAGLLRAGYSLVSNVDLVALPYPPPPYPAGVDGCTPITRKYFNLTAARHPLAQLRGLSFSEATEGRFAFPEKYVAAEVVSEGAIFEVHNAHAPPGSTRKVIKPQAFEAMRRRVDERTDLPQILCGDFNTPQPEHHGQPVRAFGEWHPGLAPRWDLAELGILDHPRLKDAYRIHRSRTGDTGAFAVSHLVKNSPVPERRYDHIYVSAHFTVDVCRYRTDWLDERRSDHAAVQVDLRIERDD